MMLVSLIFALSFSSNFVINLTRSDADTQSFFILKGNGSRAELIRNGSTIEFYYHNSSSNAHYQIIDNSSLISFRWPALINFKEMRHVAGVILSDENAEFYTFSVADSQQVDVLPTQGSGKETKHYYMIGLVVILLVLVEPPAAFLHYISSKQRRIPQLNSSV